VAGCIILRGSEQGPDPHPEGKKNSGEQGDEYVCRIDQEKSEETTLVREKVGDRPICAYARRLGGIGLRVEKRKSAKGRTLGGSPGTES